MIFKSEQAGNDLLDAFTYIGKDNPRAAEHFMDAAEAAIQRLEDLPGLGRVWNSSGSMAFAAGQFPNFKSTSSFIAKLSRALMYSACFIQNEISMHFWKNNNYSANA